jgi:hypothetical protein
MMRRLTGAAAALLIVGSCMAFAASATKPAATDAAAFTDTKTISRTHLANGSDVVADTRTFSVSVNETKNLRGFQQIDVAWTGAHPTTGIQPDPNSLNASQYEEYPVVLLECSGVDSANPPASQHQLDPTTCWTNNAQQRYQETQEPFPAWRLDRYATAEQRKAVVGEPAPLPEACHPAAVRTWIPFHGGNGSTYNGGPGVDGGCAGLAPEASGAASALALPSNETFAATLADGTGRAKFHVWTAEVNASLGCSTQVPCALVVVPVMGVSCDVAGAATTLPPEDVPSPGPVADDSATECTRGGHLAPTGNSPGDLGDLAVSGRLWWAASNWRNRITVPLSFAPGSGACDVVSGKPEIEVYGSELMTEAALQWAQHFCFDSSFKFKHVQTPEPQARSILAKGDINAAFASDVPPDGYAKPTVNAPVALTGFAIAFSIDDAQRHEVTRLRMTPRLLAKLLTESYPANPIVKTGYTALANNPLDMSEDPEFMALNPGIATLRGQESRATLVYLSSDSDVMDALTSYIAGDPEAKAWLEGTPDPWGMVVNPNYRTKGTGQDPTPKVALPTSLWPLQDTFLGPFNENSNRCLLDNPVPYLPQVASPMGRLVYIAQAMEFSVANSQTRCQDGPSDNPRAGQRLVPVGRQQQGFRFMLGVTSLAEIHRYGLNAAELQTQVSAGTPAKFTSASGRTFVAPADASLGAAAKLLAPDEATRTWPIPYETMRTKPEGAAAYPGTMVVYAQVPAKDLPAADAARYAELLTFAAGAGQVPGTATGQLPLGYLPMTQANGLAPLAAYTKAAAAVVAAQSGVVPPIVAGSPATPASPSPAASGSPTGDASSPGAVGSSGGGSVPAFRGGGARGSTVSAQQPATAPGLPGVVAGAVAAVGRTLALISHAAGSAVRWLLYLAAGGLLGAAAFWIAARRRGVKLSPKGLIAAMREWLLTVVARRRAPP